MKAKRILRTVYLIKLRLFFKTETVTELTVKPKRKRKLRPMC